MDSDCIIEDSGYFCTGYDCKNCDKYKGDNKMKFNWKEFENNRIVINCRTLEEKENFFKECEKRKICLDEYELEENSWNKFGEKTCYSIYQSGRLLFSYLDYYKKLNCKILQWSDYMKKEYNINEIFNCENGTEFKVIYSSGRIDKNTIIIKEGFIEWKLSKSPIITTNKILNAKFIKVETKIEVPFMEAIEAYRNGKTIICKYNKNLTEYEICDSLYDLIKDKNGFGISPKEILEGKWYIKED